MIPHFQSLISVPSRALTALLMLASAALLPAGAQAQSDYPSKPVRVVIPFGPGSATDIVARTISEELRAEFNQLFVVENRAGANGFIAAQAVATAAPDGHTLMVTSSTTHSTNPSLFKKLPYDPEKDFVAIGGIIEAYYVLTVNKDLPVKTVPELIDWIRANAAQANYGWGATVSQITSSAFLQRAGVRANGIGYKSSPQAVTDLIGGQLQFMFQDVTTGLAHIKAGRVRALFVTSPARNPQIADIPTAAEAGLSGFEASTYVGMLAPAGTPAAIVDRLSVALRKVLRRPDVAQKMDACCSATTFISTPAEFDQYLKRDRAEWAKKIAAAGVDPQ